MRTFFLEALRVVKTSKFCASPFGFFFTPFPPFKDLDLS